MPTIEIVLIFKKMTHNFKLGNIIELFRLMPISLFYLLQFTIVNVIIISPDIKKELFVIAHLGMFVF